MNTFDDAKKAKWITKYIIKDLIGKNTNIRFASLFLEADEDLEVYKDVEDYSSDSDFNDLVLFAIVIKNQFFRVKLVMQDRDTGFWIHLVKYNKNGELHDDGIDTNNENWKDVLDSIYHCLCMKELSLEDSYDYLLKNLFKKT